MPGALLPMRQRLPAVLYSAMLPTSQAAASPDNQDRFWSGAVRWRLLARAKLPIRQPRLLPIEDFQLEVRGTLPARSPCTRYRKVFQQPRYRKVFRVPSFRLCAGPTLMAWAKSKGPDGSEAAGRRQAAEYLQKLPD